MQPIQKKHTDFSTYGNDQSQRLAIAIQQGCTEELSRFYDQYSPALYGFITRVLGTNAVSENILHKAFVTICSRMATYNPDKEYLLTWMLKIAMNTAIEALPEYESAVINEADEHSSSARCLNNAITLIYFKGLKLEEVANRLAMPLNVLIPRMKFAAKQLNGGLAS